MKFSKANTALHFLDDNDPMAYSVCPPERNNVDVINFVRQEFDALRPAFASNIFYTSPNFQQSFLKGDWPKDVGGPPNDGAVRGTWIAQGDGDFTQTTFFDLSYTQRPSGAFGYRGTLIMMMSHPEVKIPELYICFHHGDRTIMTASSLFYMPFRLVDAVIGLIQLLHHIKHVDVSKKIVESLEVDGDYSNDTHYPILVLEPVIAEGSNRKQAYGPRGELQRMQWIPAHKRRDRVWRKIDDAAAGLN